MQHPAAPAFLIGANLPWVRYGDFGANAWQPRGGLALRNDLPLVEAQLVELAAHGVRALRWFLLCDGRAGVRFAPDGTPLGYDGALERDVDAALGLAGRAGLQVVFVVLDFHWCRRRRVHRRVPLGGHARVLRDDRRRAALLDRVLDPLLQRFGDAPEVLAWDLMNEPEWVTFGLGTWRPWAVTRSQMRAYLAGGVERVHARTRHLATVGSASTRWLGLVRGLGLDVYQPHWYDALDSRAPLSHTVSGLELDRPAWLGELPTRGSRHRPRALLEAARRAGYAGAFFWSARASDRRTDAQAALDALHAWPA
jgi:hypothetical protein